MMLDQKTRLKAERLGLDVEIEIVAKALAGLRGRSLLLAWVELNRPNFITYAFWQGLLFAGECSVAEFHDGISIRY
jgi:hypothetical protein